LREAVASGVDMFDCVLPTRLARHGVGVTEEGNVNLMNAKHKTDFSPLDPSLRLRNLSRVLACLFASLAQVPRDSGVASADLSQHLFLFAVDGAFAGGDCRRVSLPAS
jgi:hypothetical protein